mgnify:CR=1 FL=1
MHDAPMNNDYQRIEKAISWLRDHAAEQPSLAEAAGVLGLSEFHFQRLFLEWAGVTPKEFVQVLTLRRAKALLDESKPLLDAAFAVGMSGPSRLHDLFVGIERMTPGDYKRAAAGMTIRWTLAPTRFGAALFAATDRGLCRIAFLDSKEAAMAELAAEWPGARHVEDARALAGFVEEVDRRMRGDAPRDRLGLLLRGSPLRLKVWEALLRVPRGAMISYTDLAAQAGEPRAVRAVASSVADNPIGYLVPCHRVIRATGAINEYRWGSARKAVILGCEQPRLGVVGAAGMAPG